jgi:TonB family protein
MHARSFSFHLISWQERAAILCFAAALTAASLAGPSATLNQMRSSPSIVYVLISPISKSQLLEGKAGPPHHYEWEAAYLRDRLAFTPPMVRVSDLPAGAKRLGGPPLVYPPDLLAQGRWGSADIECKIDTSGRPSQCVVIASDGGDAFAEAALTFVSNGQYNPGMENGFAVASMHSFPIEFKAPGPQRLAGPPLVYPARELARGMEGWADIQCDLDQMGSPGNCSVIGRAGPRSFADSALDYVSSGQYKPLLRDESAVPDPGRRFHIEFRVPN